MSWVPVLALCAIALGLKVAGAVVATRGGGAAADRGLDVVVVPVLAGLIVVQVLGAERELVVDARLPAVLVAALLVWRGAPLLLVVAAAGATAALLRAAGLG